MKYLFHITEQPYISFSPNIKGTEYIAQYGTGDDRVRVGMVVEDGSTMTQEQARAKLAEHFTNELIKMGKIKE
jgi:uncharacterized lipoprotein